MAASTLSTSALAASLAAEADVEGGSATDAAPEDEGPDPEVLHTVLLQSRRRCRSKPGKEQAEPAS